MLKTKLITDFVSQHQLADSFIASAEHYFTDYADHLYQNFLKQNQDGNGNKIPLMVAINGCQGSGKSTLVAFIKYYLSERYQLNVIDLSLDDFYLSSQQRQALSDSIHPLLKTRGVPGSHDTVLLRETLSKLAAGQACLLPRFDKASDNPIAQEQWQVSKAPADIVLLEGWCWGVMPQTEQQLKHPCNKLEHEHDGDGRWRDYFNQQLSEHYQPLYRYFDTWLMLQAPSFACVADWRWQQEQKLSQSLNQTQASSSIGLMNKAQIDHFIQHFQRLTELALSELPERCQQVFILNKEREIIASGDHSASLSQPLIFTDLDGTLLDHHSYRFDAALPLIEKFKRQNTPIVINSSKTFAEIRQLQNQLALNEPFIVENGAAVYVPQGYFACKPNGMNAIDGFWVKRFNKPRHHWLDLLNQIKSSSHYQFDHFDNMSVAQVADCTGLTLAQAELAQQRQFGEPILWRDSDENKAHFIDQITELGGHILHGGRFIHLTGKGDKGCAMQYLVDIYQEQQKQFNFVSYALGDSGNDNDMLERADIAIQIRSPKHDFPILKRTHQFYQSQAYGPEGWQQCLTELLFSSADTANQEH